MGKISYACDISKLGRSYIENNYDELRKEILDNKIDCTYYIEVSGERFGYYIHINKPLTKIYSYNVYMVDFILSSVDLLNKDDYRQCINKMMIELNKQISSTSGYYILRMPAHIFDLIVAFNTVINNSIFCGGLVTFISTGKVENIKESDQFRLSVPNDKYVMDHKNDLIKIAEESFKGYKGQYHISHITNNHANDIYTDWIKKVFEDRVDKQKIIVAENDRDIIGFWTYDEDDIAQHTGITGVSGKYRGEGVFKRMFSEANNIAYNKNKFMTMGTKIDNYIAQRVCCDLGLKPFISYYNFHIDNR